MEKTVTYIYPNTEKAAHLKVFQDRTTQIKAFYFTRDNVKEVEKLESATNYAVYFLFDKSGDNELTTVYVGQSKNGALRIETHRQNKQFWSYCIMFVTDNNSFDAMTIDYMEYHYIKMLKKSSQYFLDNKDLRSNEPVISIYDKPIIMSYIEQIDFLLRAEGVEFSEEHLSSTVKYYSPRSPKHEAKLFVQGGKFILSAGSVIVRPIATSKEWSDDGRFFNRNNRIIDRWLAEEKIFVQGNVFRATVNLSFDSPSMAGSFVTGRSTNGWQFFRGLTELRDA